MIKAFLFDLDWVVIDSESYNDRSTRIILEDFNTEYDRDYIKPLIAGKSDVECDDFIVKHHNVPLGGSEFGKRRRELKKLFYEFKIPLMKDFLTFFKRLRDNFSLPVAIVTGCNKEYFDLIDARLVISKKFNNNIFYSEKVARNKPEPDVFIYAAKRMNVDPTECVVFEDSPAGIVSAYRAGCEVFALTTTFSKEELIKSIALLESNFVADEVMFVSSFKELFDMNLFSFKNTF